MRSEARHRLKEDRFAETTHDLFSWMQEHSVNVIGGVIIATAIIGLSVGGYLYLQNHEQKASLNLGLALDTLNAPIRPASQPAPLPDAKEESYASSKERALAAQKKFQAIIDQYPHTAAGKASRYFVAVTQIQAGDNAAGEAALKNISASGDKEYAPLAKLALASLYASGTRTPEAIALYKDLADHPSHAVSKEMAQFQLAGIYETTQPEEAKKIYQQLQKDDPTGEIGQLAMRKMFGIGRNTQMPLQGLQPEY